MRLLINLMKYISAVNYQLPSLVVITHFLLLFITNLYTFIVDDINQPLIDDTELSTTAQLAG